MKRTNFRVNIDITLWQRRKITPSMKSSKKKRTINEREKTIVNFPRMMVGGREKCQYAIKMYAYKRLYVLVYYIYHIYNYT